MTYNTGAPMPQTLSCTYKEFPSLLKNICEDTRFVISGKYEPLSEEQLLDFGVPLDDIEDYYCLNHIIHLLKTVDEKHRFELDLQNLTDCEDTKFYFDGIASLKGFIIPSCLEYLPHFNDCKNLEYIEVPKGKCKIIQECSICSCPMLKKLVIKTILKKVDHEAFYDFENVQVEYDCNRPDSVYYTLKRDEFDADAYIIETERLLIKPLLKKHYDDAVKYYTDKRNLTYEEAEYGTVSFVKSNLENSENRWRDADFCLCHFAVFRKENGKNIGHIPLSKATPRSEKVEGLKDQTGYEIGWGFDFDYHNKGYCTEAAKAVLNWAFEFLNTDRVFAYADERNLASISVMEKLQMCYEKKFPNTCNGKEITQVLYAMDREFWDVIKFSL